ncbi:FecR domain-containing protein [Chitinophaga caseinilytica]|uniref:FecR domain-containing protein n=1 Tax=Chitinophaga caseinilytica TaxID=2267521 RepID=A0ABZ2Z785_9BACT
MEDSIYIRLLLVRRILGQITPEEQAELDAILDSDPEARALRDELLQIPKEDLQQAFSSFDVNTGLLDVYDRQHEMQRRRRRAIVRSIAGAAVAAMLAGAIWLVATKPATKAPATFAAVTEGGSASLVLEDGTTIPLADTGVQTHHSNAANFTNNNRVLAIDGENAPAEGWSTLVVPARLDYQVNLEDGSTVWLNSRSRLRFRFDNGSQREVFLEAGEAYFKVKASAKNPFTVHTPQGDVQVLGTEFNVNAYIQHKMVASLVNGKVAVRSGVDRIELNPGSEALVNAGESIKVAAFDANRTLSWRQGIHYFENATVTEIAVMLDRWFNTPLVIDNPNVGRERLWGRLDRNKPIQEFIDVINLTGDVTFYWKGGELHVK